VKHVEQDYIIFCWINIERKKGLGPCTYTFHFNLLRTCL